MTSLDQSVLVESRSARDQHLQSIDNDRAFDHLKA